MNTDKRSDGNRATLSGAKCHEAQRRDESLIISDGSLETLTERIIAAAFEVSNVLGHGFLEGVYQKALIHELRQRELAAHSQAAFRVHYKGKAIGHYYADLLVEQSVVVELKAISALQPAHVGQVLNYLRASSLRVGLLLNFGRPKLEYRRVIL